MGQPKQLLQLGNRTVIRYCLDAIIAAGLQDIIVVVGSDGDEIAAAIRGLPVVIVRNESRQSEMAASVRIGLRAVEDHASGVLICLTDHPLASGDTLEVLVIEHQATPDKIIIPAYRGKRGHPTLFPRSVVEEVFSGDNLRDVIGRDPGRVRIIDVGDEGVVLDMDTREDYENIVQKLAARKGR
ncbi:MAG TPA: nucleotidyltransferase family protein [Nitrospirota bacterium]|nr:nucleotidyltransferase family protein [Nitrospirota bacterium]